jgi:hypothetical protein
MIAIQRSDHPRALWQYYAHCECGWCGPIHNTGWRHEDRDAAQQDFLDHQRCAQEAHRARRDV